MHVQPWPFANARPPVAVLSEGLLVSCFSIPAPRRSTPPHATLVLVRAASDRAKPCPDFAYGFCAVELPLYALRKFATQATSK